MTVETCNGVKNLSLISFNGKASSVSVNLGKPVFDNEVKRKTVNFGGKEYEVDFVNVGNPHCVIFCDKVDDIDIDALGQAVSESGLFPLGTYVECARVVNNLTVKLRVWEKENGETLSCGTAAAAAAVVAAANGLCKYDEVITVKLKGGDLFVKCEKEGDIQLDGSVKLSFEGSIEI